MQKSQYIEAEGPNQETFDVPDDVDNYFPQLLSAINVLEMKYRELSRIMGLVKESVAGQGGNLKLMSHYLKQASLPLDCLDASCKTCPKRCDSFMHVARGLESFSRIHAENHSRLLEESIDFLQLQTDMFESVKVVKLISNAKDLLSRREKFVAEIDLPSIVQRIENGNAKLSELNRRDGVDADVQKISSALDHVNYLL